MISTRFTCKPGDKLAAGRLLTHEQGPMSVSRPAAGVLQPAGQHAPPYPAPGPPTQRGGPPRGGRGGRVDGHEQLLVLEQNLEEKSAQEARQRRSVACAGKNASKYQN